MKSKLVCALLLTFVGGIGATQGDTRCYELRVYYAAPGKLDALKARFRDHTCALFTKHGFTNIGYWVPVENPENKLIYIIASPSREAHDKAWKSFAADPEWTAVVKTTEADGKLVTKADSIYLKATDFSPEAAPSSSDSPRCFELRTYTPAPSKMDALLARFRDHTLKLFTKHGMTNIGYWTRVDKDQNQLIYILAHKSKAQAEESFKKFRADPEWQEVKKTSEVNGSLTDKVESLFMTPLDYSPLK
ncbi:MAG: NIPSNAP family protein [Candidatus Hydrogenedentes bacterium]|nr:NIPSNAP family protein [Candidatus Hydrogenedentota bacterium]